MIVVMIVLMIVVKIVLMVVDMIVLMIVANWASYGEFQGGSFSGPKKTRQIERGTAILSIFPFEKFQWYTKLVSSLKFKFCMKFKFYMKFKFSYEI